jgi:BppU N-terminal domain
MSTTNQNFTMYEGNNRKISVYISRSDGTPFDLTGAKGTWILKRKGVTLCTKSIGSGIEIKDATKGYLAIYLLPEDTKGKLGECDHELQIEDASASVYTVLTGRISIQGSLLTD